MTLIEKMLIILYAKYEAKYDYKLDIQMKMIIIMMVM